MSYTTNVYATSISNNSANKFGYFSLEDGWYNSTVKYSNYNTGTFANYRLKVKVEYERVTTISFGNGGSVHTGYNNEGYIYSGGYLEAERDYDGRVVAYTTKITVSDTNGMRTFNIRID